MKIWHYFIISIAIVATPIIVNLILHISNPISDWLPMVCSPTEWIGFWGNYAGAIIGGLITLYVLRYTIKGNARIRDVQVKTIKYTQQQTWLDNLRQQVIGNYNMLDMQSLSIALYKLQNREYEDAQMSLLSLNRNIEFQTNSSSLYFLHDELSQEEQEYNSCLKRILVEFGCLINDSIFFTSIFPDLTRESEPHVYSMSYQTIVSFAKNSYDAIVSSAMFDTDTQNYYSENSILSKIMKLDFRDTEFLIEVQ